MPDYVEMDPKLRAAFESECKTTRDNAIKSLSADVKKFVLVVQRGDDKIEVFQSADPMYVLKVGIKLQQIADAQLDNLPDPLFNATT